MIIIKHSGNFNHMEKFLKYSTRINIRNILKRYGAQGVTALFYATPKNTGLTASSWDYEIKITKSGFSIVWTNSNNENGVPVAILIQYGHATRNGGYVPGINFINPVIDPIFKKIADDIWEEVSKL